MKMAQDREGVRESFAAAEGNMFSTAIYRRLACVTLPLNSITNKVAFLTLGHNVVIIGEKALGEQQIPFRMPNLALNSFLYLGLFSNFMSLFSVRDFA